VDVVEVVEGAQVEASSRCSSTQSQQLLAEDNSMTLRQMVMVDGAVCDLGHAQDRGGDAQVATTVALRSGVATTSSFSRSAAVLVRRRIERLLDEDRRRVAPPPEEAATPVGWLDHEHRPSGVSTMNGTNGRATQT
jgi:hypothetical protein